MKLLKISIVIFILTQQFIRAEETVIVPATMSYPIEYERIHSLFSLDSPTKKDLEILMLLYSRSLRAEPTLPLIHEKAKDYVSTRINNEYQALKKRFDDNLSSFDVLGLKALYLDFDNLEFIEKTYKRFYKIVFDSVYDKLLRVYLDKETNDEKIYECYGSIIRILESMLNQLKSRQEKEALLALLSQESFFLKLKKIINVGKKDFDFVIRNILLEVSLEFLAYIRLAQAKILLKNTEYFTEQTKMSPFDVSLAYVYEAKEHYNKSYSLFVYEVPPFKKYLGPIPNYSIVIPKFDELYEAIKRIKTTTKFRNENYHTSLQTNDPKALVKTIQAEARRIDELQEEKLQSALKNRKITKTDTINDSFSAQFADENQEAIALDFYIEPEVSETYFAKNVIDEFNLKTADGVSSKNRKLQSFVYKNTKYEHTYYGRISRKKKMIVLPKGFVPVTDSVVIINKEKVSYSFSQDEYGFIYFELTQKPTKDIYFSLGIVLDENKHNPPVSLPNTLENKLKQKLFTGTYSSHTEEHLFDTLKENKTLSWIVESTNNYIQDSYVYFAGLDYQKQIFHGKYKNKVEAIDRSIETISLHYKGKNVRPSICNITALVATAYLRELGIPTVIVVGYSHKGNNMFIPHAWIRYYNGKKWISLDPTARNIMKNFIFKNVPISNTSMRYPKWEAFRLKEKLEERTQKQKFYERIDVLKKEFEEIERIDPFEGITNYTDPISKSIALRKSDEKLKKQNEQEDIFLHYTNEFIKHLNEAHTFTQTEKDKDLLGAYCEFYLGKIEYFLKNLGNRIPNEDSLQLNELINKFRQCFNGSNRENIYKFNAPSTIFGSDDSSGYKRNYVIIEQNNELFLKNKKTFHATKLGIKKSDYSEISKFDVLEDPITHSLINYVVSGVKKDGTLFYRHKNNDVSINRNAQDFTIDQIIIDKHSDVYLSIKTNIEYKPYYLFKNGKEIFSNATNTIWLNKSSADDSIILIPFKNKKKQKRVKILINGEYLSYKNLNDFMIEDHFTLSNKAPFIMIELDDGKSIVYCDTTLLKDEKNTIIEFPSSHKLENEWEYTHGIIFWFGNKRIQKDHKTHHKIFYRVYNRSLGLTKIINKDNNYDVYYNSVEFDVSYTHYGILLIPDYDDLPYKIIFDDEEYTLNVQMFKKSKATVLAFTINENDFSLVLKTENGFVFEIDKSSLLHGVYIADEKERPGKFSNFAAIKHQNNKFSYFINGKELTLMDGTTFYSDIKFQSPVPRYVIKENYNITKRFIPFGLEYIRYYSATEPTYDSYLYILDRQNGQIFSGKEYSHYEKLFISKSLTTLIYIEKDDHFVNVHVEGDAFNGERIIQIPRFPKKIKICAGQVRSLIVNNDGKHYMFIGVFPGKNSSKEFMYKVFKDGEVIKEWSYPREDYREDCRFNDTFTISLDSCETDNAYSNNASIECFQIKHFDEVIFDSTIEKVDKFIVTENQDEKITTLKTSIETESREEAKSELIELLHNQKNNSRDRIALIWRNYTLSRELLDPELQTKCSDEIIQARYRILETSLSAEDKALMIFFVFDELIKKYIDTEEESKKAEIIRFVHYIMSAHTTIKELVALKVYENIDSYREYKEIPIQSITKSLEIKKEIVELLDKEKTYYDKYIQKKN